MHKLIRKIKQTIKYEVSPIFGGFESVPLLHQRRLHRRARAIRRVGALFSARQDGVHFVEEDHTLQSLEIGLTPVSAQDIVILCELCDGVVRCCSFYSVQ